MPVRLQLDVSVLTGVSTVMKAIKVLHGGQFRDELNYYGLSSFFNLGGNIDALKSVSQNALQQNYNIAGRWWK